MHKQKFGFIIICLLGFTVFSGCVLRTLTINSEPSGATVYVDNNPVGETPVTIPFTYYGTRKITLEKTDADGKLLYERKIVFEKLSTPIYQYFPLDFFSEVVLPVDIKDEHFFTYRLDPINRPPVAEIQKNVIKNAEELREKLDANLAR